MLCVLRKPSRWRKAKLDEIIEKCSVERAGTTAARKAENRHLASNAKGLPDKRGTLIGWNVLQNVRSHNSIEGSVFKRQLDTRGSNGQHRSAGRTGEVHITTNE